MIVSWVHTYNDLSLGDSMILRQTRFSSRPCRFLTIVNSLTGWGSTPIALNLSTQYQVQKLRPACGGNTLSPEKNKGVKLLYSLHVGKFLMLLLSSADFYQNFLFQKILSGTLSNCQIVWIQIRTKLGQNCLLRLYTDNIAANNERVKSHHGGPK